MPRLDGKVSIITGGSMGIGYAAAQRFLKEGAEVFIVGRFEETLKQATLELGKHCHAIVADCADVKQVTSMVETAVEQFGRLDVLFLNHAFSLPGEVMDDMTEALFDRMMNTNLKGTYFAIKAARPHMRRGSTIILTSSIGGHVANRAVPVFNMTKAAIRSLTRSMCGALSAQGIRVNSISPGFTNSGVFQKIGMSAEQVATMIDRQSEQIPSGRFATVEEIANGALFLASEESSYVNGADLCIDGGVIQVMPETPTMPVA